MGGGPSRECFSRLVSDEGALEAIADENSLGVDDPAWDKILSASIKVPKDMTGQEMDDKLKVLCEHLVSHNARTGNFASLLQRATRLLKSDEVKSLPKDSREVEQQVNQASTAVMLVRLFSQHLFESGLGHADLCMHFGIQLSNKTGEGVYHGFMKALVDAIIYCPRRSPLVLHLVDTLLIQLSSQLYSALKFPVLGMDILLHHSHQGPALVSSIFDLLILPQDGASKEKAEGGVLQTFTTAASAVLFLPWHAYQYWFPHNVAAATLSDKCLMLLLAFFYYGGVEPSNCYRDAICTLADRSGKVDVENTGSAKVSFSRLFDCLAESISQPVTTLMLFTLLKQNTNFREYCLSRTDSDTLVVPLLKGLYESQDRNQRYMLLISVLLLSQDRDWCSSIHTMEVQQNLGWYKDHILVDISLGSLVVIAVTKSMKRSLGRSQDLYLQTNCVAVLANMSSSFQYLHSHAADGLLTLFQMLGRRLKFHMKKVAASGAGTGVVPQSTEANIYVDWMRLVVEMILAALSSSLERNVSLIYRLLMQDNVFEAFKTHPQLGDVVGRLLKAISFFRSKLPVGDGPQAETLSDKPVDGPVITEEGQEATLEDIQKKLENTARTASNELDLGNPPELKFTYEEEENPEEFFVPYCWSVIVDSWGMTYNSEAISLFDAAGDDTEDVSGGDEDLEV